MANSQTPAELRICNIEIQLILLLLMDL